MAGFVGLEADVAKVPDETDTVEGAVIFRAKDWTMKRQLSRHRLLDPRGAVALAHLGPRPRAGTASARPSTSPKCF